MRCGGYVRYFMTCQDFVYYVGIYTDRLGRMVYTGMFVTFWTWLQRPRALSDYRTVGGWRTRGGIDISREV